MSTSEYFDGEIRIVPPLNYAELTKAAEIALGILPKTGWASKGVNAENVFGSYMPLKFEVEHDQRTTPEGILHVTQASIIKPSNTTDGAYSSRMKPLLEALIKGLPGHNWSGTVMSIDEYRNRAVKVTVTTGKDSSSVEEVFGKGIVIWDDGSRSDVEEITG